MVYGISLDTFRLCITGVLLIAASFADIESLELPDGITIAIALAAMLRAGAHPEEQPDMLLGALLALPLLLIVLIIDKLKQTELMGGGDIKLIAALGLHFGINGTLFIIVLACAAALIFAAVTHKDRETAFPFVPMLAFAACFTAIFISI